MAEERVFAASVLGIQMQLNRAVNEEEERSLV